MKPRGFNKSFPLCPGGLATPDHPVAPPSTSRARPFRSRSADQGHPNVGRRGRRPTPVERDSRDCAEPIAAHDTCACSHPASNLARIRASSIERPCSAAVCRWLSHWFRPTDAKVKTPTEAATAHLYPFSYLRMSVDRRRMSGARRVTPAELPTHQVNQLLIHCPEGRVAATD